MIRDMSMVLEENRRKLQEIIDQQNQQKSMLDEAILIGQ